MPAIMSQPIGIPESTKVGAPAHPNIGRWRSTPPVTMITPRTKAHRPRRSDIVLVLIMECWIPAALLLSPL